MKRILSSFMAGLPITFLLFLFMSSLIESKANPPPIDPYETPTLGNIHYRDDVETIVRPELPKNDPLVKKPQTIQSSNETNDTKTPRVTVEGPMDINVLGKDEFDPSTNIQSSTPNAHSRDQDAIPSMIIEPRWPRNAKSNGFVRLCFTVSPDGSPSEIEVVESEPKRVFDKSAKRAVYRWKFKPAYIDNIAVEQHNMCYTMEFNLEN